MNSRNENLLYSCIFRKLPLSFYQQDTFEVARNLLGKILVTNVNGKITAGRIVEVEPYLGMVDKASHAYKNKKTSRTAPQFEKGGITYIFLVYGMYHQLCFVTNKKNVPDAVLIRAIEPLIGIDTMIKRRYGTSKNNKKQDENNENKKSATLDIQNMSFSKFKNLTNGPGKLTIAMGIDKTINTNKLNSDVIYVADVTLSESNNSSTIHKDSHGLTIWDAPFNKFIDKVLSIDKKITNKDIACTPRIGIDYAEEYANKPWRFYVRQSFFVSRQSNIVLRWDEAAKSFER